MSSIVTQEHTISSQLVAEMVGKEHKKLLRDIRIYSEYLIEAKIGLNDYFIESTYRDKINRELPCYLITRKGCDLIAHKLTGKRGVLFTARYIECFEQLKKKKAEPRNLEELVQSPELVIKLAEELIESRKEIDRLKGIRDQMIPEKIETAGLYTTTEIAEIYGMSAKMFNSLLWRLHIIRHIPTGWVLYAPYSDKGYAERCWKNLKWTKEGKEFLLKKLRNKGYEPVRVE